MNLFLPRYFVIDAENILPTTGHAVQRINCIAWSDSYGTLHHMEEMNENLHLIFTVENFSTGREKNWTICRTCTELICNFDFVIYFQAFVRLFYKYLFDHLNNKNVTHYCLICGKSNFTINLHIWKKKETKSTLIISFTCICIKFLPPVLDFQLQNSRKFTYSILGENFSPHRKKISCQPCSTAKVTDFF